MLGTIETANAEGGDGFLLWERDMGSRAIELVIALEQLEAKQLGAIAITNHP